jgi:hypothetical protein
MHILYTNNALPPAPAWSEMTKKLLTGPVGSRYTGPGLVPVFPPLEGDRGT